ncbi:uncharacterized protein LOC123527081 [Mercenaria mercenaria]|uniref:uncharacterized protein LOC123527081 n=1 Tax=Mercenaria mercenaria TaxID=6596 RepID=UPI00234E7EFC|nr:uncharacterized protein LOC123527081 [Mercenaria mercenaria]
MASVPRVVIVKLKDRKIAVQTTTEDTFSDIFIKAKHLGNIISDENAIKTVMIYENPSKIEPDNGILVDKTMSCQMLSDLNYRFVDFIVDEEKDANNNVDKFPANAFSLMMSEKFCLPEKPKSSHGKLTGPKKIQSDLIDLAEKLGCGWARDSLMSGERVLKKLTDALWYIDHAHKRMKDNSCQVPEIFDKFQGYNEYAKLRHRPPVIKSEKLNEICSDLADVLQLPSMSSSRNKVLKMHIESLASALAKYNARLNSNKELKTKSNADPVAASSFCEKNETACSFVPPSKKVGDKYIDLDEYLSQHDDYEYIDLDLFSPSNRYKRRDFIKHLKLSKPVMLYRVAYGGSVGTVNFIWSVPYDTSQTRLEKNSSVMNSINEELPKFSNRQMRRDFINRYIDYVKCPKSVLRNMYFDLTGCEPTAESSHQRHVNDRVSEILMGSDDTKLLLDLRSMNGSDTKYDEFYDAVGNYFEEQILHVHERRKAQELYLPLSISIEDLREQVKKRLPEGTSVPSTEALRLQFTPSNQFAETALRFTSRFNVKFRVQTRLARVSHPDAHYVAAYYKYLKHFCVMFKEYTHFVCLDDKSIVPVGEPGIPISTGVRGHNKVMTPSTGPKLVAADHDFHVAGIVPSVALVTDIPDCADDSFFQGNVYVTCKDKVFQASTPFRHCTELVHIFRENHSLNEVDLDRPILCIFTDGGPDHRLTYESVKVSLLAMFLALDLDFLIALRTAPNHSWMNPAERCMSILNLALQHVSLCREEMNEQSEKSLKGKSSLGALRNLADIKPGFKEAFKGSIGPVIKTVSDRFSRMKLKGTSLKVCAAASDEDIESDLDFLKLVTSSPGASFDSSSKSKDFKTCIPLQEFLKSHSVSGHYSFQVMKCKSTSCAYCTFNPIREEEVYNRLSFLPEPTPDVSGEHYLPFEEVYGKSQTLDKYRPSAKHGDFEDDLIEEDKKNRDILKAQKVRDVIKCGECNKPRLVYSSSRTERAQDAYLHRVKEDRLYICGDQLEENCGLFMQRTINCNSDISISYYSPNCSRWTVAVCCYCGSPDNIMDDNEPYIQDLYTKYSKVRPLCHPCRTAGKDAKTWGQKFIKKRK